MNVVQVRVGSINPVKVDAVREMLTLYDEFRGCEVLGVDVGSSVDEQPKSLEETVRGALFRATNARLSATAATAAHASIVGFGIESGVFLSGLHPEIAPSLLDICACVIVGPRGVAYQGLSSAWEVPNDVATRIYNAGLDLDAAFRDTGRTTEAMNRGKGVLSVVSGGRQTRKTFTQQAIAAALIGLLTRDR